MQAFPVKDKSKNSYKAALLSFIQFYDYSISSFCSDREGALSTRFKKFLLDNYGIRCYHILSHSKAYRAEAAIKYLKIRLSTAVEASLEIARKKASAKGQKLSKAENLKLRYWLDHLENIIVHYNQQLIPGTNIKRGSVRKDTQLALISALYRTNEPLSLLSEGTRSRWPSQFLNLFFRYSIGEKVHLAIRSFYKLKNIFVKYSVEGNYHPRIFIIHERRLKTNRRFTIVPTYRLKDTTTNEVLEGIFYASEMIAVLHLNKLNKQKKRLLEQEMEKEEEE